jgi:hypothetical protein
MRPVLALARITCVEALRSRLALVFAAAALLVLAAAAGLEALDAGARLKLALVVATAAMAGTSGLLAILVAAQQVRRDLDARHVLMLFSKPVGRLQYLLGRWLGLQAFLLAGSALLALAGTVAVAATQGAAPRLLAVAEPVAWNEVTPLGEALPSPEGRERIALSGPAGGAVRFRLAGLDDPGEAGLSLLVRAQVRGDLGVETCRVAVAAAPGTAPEGRLRTLALHPDSPYGRGLAGEEAPEGQAALRNREAERSDYGQDWARFVLRREDVAPDGSCTVQVARLESASALLLARSGSLAVARDGGSLLANLLRGTLAVLAAAGMLAACALLAGTLAGLPVSLLAGLALAFAGSAAWTIQDTLVYEKLSLPAQRLLQALQLLLPDFGRQQVAERLASGRALGWDAVGAAWAYFGAYTAILLGLGWWSLARKEL